MEVALVRKGKSGQMKERGEKKKKSSGDCGPRI